jgi:general secretion pathway protein H
MRPSPSRSWASDAGVTLIEMLVVLAIIALAFALALPNLQGAARSVGVRTTAFDMKMHLGVARAAAIAKGRPMAVVIDVGGRRYASEADDRWVALPPGLGVRVTSMRDPGGNAQRPRLVFFPDGSSTGGAILLKRDNAAFNVAVDWLTGEASVEARP